MANLRFRFWNRLPKDCGRGSCRMRRRVAGRRRLRLYASRVFAAMSGISHGANLTIARRSRGAVQDVRRRRHRQVETVPFAWRSPRRDLMRASRPARAGVDERLVLPPTETPWRWSCCAVADPDIAARKTRATAPAPHTTPQRRRPATLRLVLQLPRRSPSVRRFQKPKSRRLASRGCRRRTTASACREEIALRLCSRRRRRSAAEAEGDEGIEEIERRSRVCSPRRWRNRRPSTALRQRREDLELDGAQERF